MIFLKNVKKKKKSLLEPQLMQKDPQSKVAKKVQTHCMIMQKHDQINRE